MTDIDIAAIEARDRREIEAWASLPHTLYEGHDCIRCQVSRYLRAAKARETQAWMAGHKAGIEYTNRAALQEGQRADAAEAREARLREALTQARVWVQRCANCDHDYNAHDLRIAGRWCADEELRPLPDGRWIKTGCSCHGWGGDGELLKRIDRLLALAEPEAERDE